MTFLDEPTSGWPTLPTADPGSHRPSLARLRVGDAERDDTCQTLARHYTEGRLTALEFDERSAAAVQATTALELAELTADLPRLATVMAAPASVPVPVNTSSADSARVVRILLEVGALGLTAVAGLCTLAVIMQMHEASLAALVAFGAAVTTAGTIHFVRLLHRAAGGTPAGSSAPPIAAAAPPRER